MVKGSMAELHKNRLNGRFGFEAAVAGTGPFRFRTNASQLTGVFNESSYTDPPQPPQAAAPPLSPQAAPALPAAAKSRLAASDSAALRS
jgi:hypothetical protein